MISEHKVLPIYIDAVGDVASFPLPSVLDSIENADLTVGSKQRQCCKACSRKGNRSARQLRQQAAKRRQRVLMLESDAPGSPPVPHSHTSQNHHLIMPEKLK